MKQTSVLGCRNCFSSAPHMVWNKCFI